MAAINSMRRDLDWAMIAILGVSRNMKMEKLTANPAPDAAATPVSLLNPMEANLRIAIKYAGWRFKKQYYG